MKISDAILGALLAGLGLAVLLVVSSYPKMPGQDVGPAMFPGAAAILLVAFGSALTIRTLLAPGGGRAVLRLGDWSRSPRHVMAGLSVVVGCVLYVLFAQRIGFLATMPPILFVVHRTFGAGALASAVSAMATTAIAWAIFYKGLGVPLPWGFLKAVAF